MKNSYGISIHRILTLVGVLLVLCGADVLRETRTESKFIGEWDVVKDFSTTTCEADFMLRVSHSMTVLPDLSAKDNFYDIPLKRHSVGPRRLVLQGKKVNKESCTTKRQVELTYPSNNSVRYRDKTWFVCKGHPTCSSSYSGKALKITN